MSLRERVEADETSPGGKCPVRVLVSGGIPKGSENTSPLDPADREYLAESCIPGSEAVLAKITRDLNIHGYRVGSTALPAHRRGDCACSANNSAESPDSARNTAGCAP